MKYVKLQNPRYISKPHSYKTHLGIKRSNQFWKLACGRDLLNARGITGNDFTYDKDKVTCERCLNTLKVKETKTIKLVKPIFWQKWTGSGTWEKATKTDVNYYLTKEEIKRVMNGEQVLNKNFWYAYGLEKPNN